MKNLTRTPAILAFCFLKLGLQGFGGLGSVLALISHDLVEQRAWLDQAEITEALTYTKLLPGSTVVQIVAYLGWKLGGWMGAFVATVAFLLPAFLMMLGLAIAYRSTLSIQVQSTISGLNAAVVGMLILTAWTLGCKNITEVSGIVIAILSLITSVQFSINPIHCGVNSRNMGYFS
ncbi:chromate transporter (plasmid) [Pseudanabaena biceps]|nr:chromate transporter [Pseudanabaena biceps]